MTAVKCRQRYERYVYHGSTVMSAKCRQGHERCCGEKEVQCISLMQVYKESRSITDKKTPIYLTNDRFTSRGKLALLQAENLQKKSFDLDQPVQTAQADLGQFFFFLERE